jgi:hypothetical protein
MTGEKDLFTSLELHDITKETIVIGDNSKGDLIGLGKIALSNDNSISNVYLVETLGYNFLSVSQLYKMGYNCLFTNESVTVLRKEDSSIAFTGHLKGKIYLVDFSKEKIELNTCLVAKSDLGWL